MPKFTDTIIIKIRAGHGGAGAVSYRREKFVPFGGPDGGDGGKGGNVYFVADRNYTSLSFLNKDRTYSAKSGLPGEGEHKHGADGEDLIIKMPFGTEVVDITTNDIVADLIDEDVPVLIAAGGVGGKGNAFFKSSTHQTPHFSQPGLPGLELEIRLNLKLIADVGLVGLPNAGKSTLLSVISNAKPKIADYPFTTLIPNLGVVKLSDDEEFTVADIPGIIEGAHLGHGLGLSFLQHIERVRVLLFLIDIQDDDPLYAFELLKMELKSYNEKLLDKPYYIVLTKTDVIDNDENLIADISGLFKTDNILSISSINDYHVKELLKVVSGLLN